MEYTKEQRHEIYKKALKRKDFGAGLCFAILWAAGDFDSNASGSLILFPEFTQFKPIKLPTSSSYWFGRADDGVGNDIRETVLEFCIEMTKPE